MRRHRPKHSELSDAARARANIRSYTNVLIRRGQLERPAACPSCGRPGPVQARHLDYDDPRNIQWLCIGCRRAMEDTSSLPAQGR